MLRISINLLNEDNYTFSAKNMATCETMNIQLVQIYETEANWIYWLYIYKSGYCVFEHIGLLVTFQKSYLFLTCLDGNFIYNSHTFLNIFESVLCGFHSMREWGAA